MSRLGERRGIALPLVLWLLVVMGAVGVVIVSSTRTAAAAVLNLRARTLGRYAAESGVVAAVARIERRLRSANTAADQVGVFAGLTRELAGLQDVSLGEARFGVAMVNLSARLDLNRGDPAAVAGLFAQFGPAQRAEAMVGALADWQDPDDLARPQGAEREEYLRAGSPFVPHNAPLLRTDELSHVLGIPAALARGVEPYVTVNGDFKIDVNAAPETVLAALPGIGAAGARQIVSARKGGPFTSLAPVLDLLISSDGAGGVAPPLSQLAVLPTRLLIVSRGWSPGRPLTHEVQAAYTIVARRLVLQAWRERDL